MLCVPEKVLPKMTAAVCEKLNCFQLSKASVIKCANLFFVYMLEGDTKEAGIILCA